jgi:hypothetical protein
MMLNNINGKMYNVIINMYDSIKSCISYNNCISNIWETELFDNVDYLKCVIKQRLEDQFLQNWNFLVQNYLKP